MSFISSFSHVFVFFTSVFRISLAFNVFHMSSFFPLETLFRFSFHCVSRLEQVCLRWVCCGRVHWMTINARCVVDLLQMRHRLFGESFHVTTLRFHSLSWVCRCDLKKKNLFTRMRRDDTPTASLILVMTESPLSANRCLQPKYN